MNGYAPLQGHGVITTPAVVTAVVAGVNLAVALLAVLFARAPGWRHLRTFAAVAFFAGCFGLSNVGYAMSSVPDSALPILGRTTIAIAILHTCAWVVYGRHQAGEVLSRFECGVLIFLITIAAAVLVPGVATVDGVRLSVIPALGFTYRFPISTTFGDAVGLIVGVALVIPLVHFIRRYRQGLPGAFKHIVAYWIYGATAVNEVALLMGVPTPSMADLGFLAIVGAMALELVRQVNDHRSKFEQLAGNLEQQVGQRDSQLFAARDALMRSERQVALGQLAAGVGHEINNPLTYIVANLEFLRDHLDAGSVELTAATAEALDGAARIRRIVGDLKVFGRGKSDDRTGVVVAEVLDSAIKLARHAIRHRAVLERQDGPLPVVKADASRLAQVFVNLLVNAADAFPDSRAGDPNAIIRVHAFTDERGRAVIEIIDTGVGIAAEDQKRLFEPYFSTKPVGEGTGLGLFVSRGIIEDLGGDLTIDSKVGRGTTVRICLPPSTGSGRPQPVSLDPPAVQTRRLRLLLVDDDPLVIRGLIRMLRQHEVESVADGESALALLRDAPNYDVVLCDLMMPGMSGMQLYRAVQDEVPEMSSRFLFVTGGAVTEASRTFLDRDDVRWLPKPLVQRDLMAALQAFTEPGPADVPDDPS